MAAIVRTLEIGGRKVDLKKIYMPVLNIYAEQDHLDPRSSLKDLKKYISSKDITTKNFPVGHIGMYVSSKSPKTLSLMIANWLFERTPGGVETKKTCLQIGTTEIPEAHPKCHGKTIKIGVLP